VTPIFSLVSIPFLPLLQIKSSISSNFTGALRFDAGEMLEIQHFVYFFAAVGN